MVCDHPPLPAKIVAPHSAKPFANLHRPYAAVVALVDGKGAVTNAWVDVNSGNGDYDKAAVTAMKAWTFLPAAAGCQAMPGESEWVVGGNDYAFADPCEHEARVTLGVTPETSPIVTQAAVPYTAQVRVSLDQFGEVKAVKLAVRSGSAEFDDATLKAAKAQNYFPKVQACMPQASDYIFSAQVGQ